MADIADMPPQHVLTRNVITIYVLAVFSAAAIVIVEWTSLPYLRYINFATSSDFSFYFFLSSIVLLTPVFITPCLGFLATRFGSAIVLSGSLAIVSLGTSLIATVRYSRTFLAFAWVLYAVNPALRVIRLSLIAEIVPTEHRTFVMALHYFMAPFGSVLGPIAWLGFDALSPHFTLYDTIAVDQYSVLFGLVALGAAVCSVVAFRIARRLATRDVLCDESAEAPQVRESEDYGSIATSGRENQDESIAVEVRAEDAVVQSLPWSRLLLVGAIMIFSRFSVVIAISVLQPIMVTIFHTSETELGHIYLIILVLSLLPPLLVAWLSRRLTDRSLLKIGLISKSLGALLYLPLFGNLRKLQFILGFTLVVKASAFFSTAAMSLISKLLPGRQSATALGLMWSLSSAFPALVQFAFADWLSNSLGKWRFAWILAPVWISLVVIVQPAVWSMLEVAPTTSTGTHKK